jgi:hypothetical protein
MAVPREQLIDELIKAISSLIANERRVSPGEVIVDLADFEEVRYLWRKLVSK